MIGDEAQAQAWLAALPQADAVALGRLDHLVALLTAENQCQNLVSATSLAEVWRRHIVDSAQLLCHIPAIKGGPWLDLGTGAGFPGLVVACLLPDCEVVMVESRARRIDWLQRAIDALGLPQARVIGQRLEQVAAVKAAVISARAFAPLDKLVNLAARFSSPTTLWLLPKGRSAQQELQALQGWQHMFHVEQSLTDADGGIITGTLTGAIGKKGHRA
jgi:16S rRNA (guanine527-N7)-methyltransferase